MFFKKLLCFELSKLVNMLANFSQATNEFYTIEFRFVGFTFLHCESLEESNKQNELFNTNRLPSCLNLKVSRKYQNKIIKSIIHTSLIKNCDTLF